MKKNIDLKPYNTLQVACKAKYFVEIESTYQLLQLLETAEWNAEKHWILWWGSNTLFTSDFFDGVVAKMNIKGIKILNETDDQVLVQVGAGEDRDDFVRYSIEKRWWGIENLISIPWKVGTSAVSNVWAYGQEASNALYEVIGVNTQTKSIQKLTNEECKFGYRKSIFKEELKENFIITHCVFSLKKIKEGYDFNVEYWDIQKEFSAQHLAFDKLDPVQKLKIMTQTIAKIRERKLPDWRVVWTAGSYFKNPEIWLPQREALQKKHPELKAFLQPNERMKLAAGQLIELCGLKGYQEGNVKISDQHALILINLWGTWAEVKAFAEKVQDVVFKKFEIHLEPEVIYC